MVTNLPKGLLWEIQSRKEHRDRLTLIMFRSLKCSKSQTWLHIYEAKMHLLLILGSSLNFETLCVSPSDGNFETVRNLLRAAEKHFPLIRMNCVCHRTVDSAVTYRLKNSQQGTLLEGDKMVVRGHRRHIRTWRNDKFKWQKKQTEEHNRRCSGFKTARASVKMYDFNFRSDCSAAVRMEINKQTPSER